jgi:DNA-binding transcriptional LysR family regulator
MLNLTHLRSFVTLRQTGSFTETAARLGIGQSTVTQHIQRLERLLGRQLVLRDTHQVRFTAEGEALLGYARSMLDLNGKVASLFDESRLRGRLRLGVSEDIVANRLANVLEDFIRLYPLVDLELTVALSAVLYQMQDAGDLDLVLAKRHIGETHGRLLYREPLVWLARDPDYVLSRSDVLPLIAFPPPSITRRIAQEALDRKKMAWRVVCSCESLSGLTAAAQAGMGVLVQPRSMAPPGLNEIPAERLPLLEDVEFVLVPRRGADGVVVEALSNLIAGQMFGDRNKTSHNTRE